MASEDEVFEQQEERLRERADAFVRMVLDRGIVEDKGIKDEELRKVRQKRKKDSYHNTMLLLKNYRTISWVIECFPDAVEEELNMPFAGTDMMLERMELESCLGNKKLDSRIEGIQRSRLLMDRMNEALTVLKKKPDNGQLLYELIYLTYIGPEVLSHRELLYRLCVSSRQYYRFREQAVTILSIRLWSSPSAGMDRLMELLTFMEE